MDRAGKLGAVCTLVGIAGYTAGVITPYPGRELALVAVFIGVTLFAIGGGLP